VSKVYNGYELKNVKCMMLSIPKLSLCFENCVDVILSEISKNKTKQEDDLKEIKKLLNTY